MRAPFATARRKKGGSGHPRRQLPLLPSGPGGVRQLCVAQSQMIVIRTEKRSEHGGERGIRTLGTFRHTRFPIVLLRPLGHLSKLEGMIELAEREGFEPPVPLRVHLISNQAQSTRLCHLSRLRSLFVAAREKNRVNNAPHSAASADCSTATRWFNRGPPAADRASRPRPPWGCRSRTPARSTRALTIAPAHIGHGSCVTYSVAPTSRQPPTAAAACRMRDRSRRGPSGSAALSRRLPPRPTISPPTTTTAPTGTSPSAAAACASASASCMYSCHRLLVHFARPERIRTSDPRFRRPMLYPAELWPQRRFT